jgi:hypothetical protein
MKMLRMTLAAALISGLSLSALSVQVNARPYHQANAGIYHQDVLPDGTVTGPLGPEANGG